MEETGDNEQLYATSEEYVKNLRGEAPEESPSEEERDEVEALLDRALHKAQKLQRMQTQQQATKFWKSGNQMAVGPAQYAGAVWTTTVSSGTGTNPNNIINNGVYTIPKEEEVPIPDPHAKGVCQESYDQGYEDGLKAAQTGEKRIK